MSEENIVDPAMPPKTEPAVGTAQVSVTITVTTVGPPEAAEKLATATLTALRGLGLQSALKSPG